MEQGLYCYSMVIIALYDTLGADACAFIINQGNLLNKFEKPCPFASGILGTNVIYSYLFPTQLK